MFVSTCNSLFDIKPGPFLRPTFICSLGKLSFQKNNIIKNVCFIQHPVWVCWVSLCFVVSLHKRRQNHESSAFLCVCVCVFVTWYEPQNIGLPESAGYQRCQHQGFLETGSQRCVTPLSIHLCYSFTSFLFPSAVVLFFCLSLLVALFLLSDFLGSLDACSPSSLINPFSFSLSFFVSTCTLQTLVHFRSLSLESSQSVSCCFDAAVPLVLLINKRRLWKCLG